MPGYVIAKRGVESLDTPVFYAGRADKEEAVAVFTDRAAAQRYIERAGWADSHEVGQLDEVQLLRWTVNAHEQGVQYLAINPDRQRQMAGEWQEIIVIEEKLATFAESLTRVILNLKSAQHDARQ